MGFQFIDGDIGTDFVIDTRGSYNVFTELNIEGYTCYKYLMIREECQYVEVSYCNFENRLNLEDQKHPIDTSGRESTWLSHHSLLLLQKL